MTADTEFWCPACDRPVLEWASGPGGRPNARCLQCQSLERHRLLAAVLLGLKPVLTSGARVLDFAPAAIIRRLVERNLHEGVYVGIDLSRGLDIEAQVDATQLPFPDACFDLAISFHVLEHIPDDRQAMRELARVLMPGGRAIIQVPWRANVPTDEEVLATGAERAARYGQDDHLRYYGADFDDRLRECGLTGIRAQASDYLDAEQFRRFNVHEMPLWMLRRARPNEVVAGRGPR